MLDFAAYCARKEREELWRTVPIVSLHDARNRHRRFNPDSWWFRCIDDTDRPKQCPYGKTMPNGAYAFVVGEPGRWVVYVIDTLGTLHRVRTFLRKRSAVRAVRKHLRNGMEVCDVCFEYV